MSQNKLPIEKQMMGEELYPLIERTEPKLAGKITGMLLELDNAEILMLLICKEKLEQKVSEALRILEEHQKSLDEISLSEISPSSEGCKNEDCVICMEPLGKKNVCVTECGHSFCTSCLLRSAQRNTDCPLCRTELAPRTELVSSDDLDTAYEAGRELGFEEGEDSIRGEIYLLEDEVQQKYEEIDNLKEEVRRIEIELEQEKIKMETSLCRAYGKGYDNGILAGGKKYSEKKDVEKVKNTRPSSIDEWFKMRMSK